MKGEKKPKKKTADISEDSVINKAEEEVSTDTETAESAEPASDKGAEEKYLRCLAEFDNYRKRAEKEKLTYHSDGVRFAITAFLPVLDNFERALAASEDRESQLYKGVEMISRQFRTVFETLGAKEIEAVGKQFDTNLHNAVMHVEDEDYGRNEVVEELQKGYTYKDRVIRHSMVKVAN